MLESGDLKRTLLTLAIPGVVSMLVNAVYNVVDTLFIGMLHDTAALGATAIIFPIFLLTGAIGLAFGMGAASVVSRRLGEKKREEASRVATTAILTTFCVGVVMAIIGFSFATPLLRLLGATDTILSAAKSYGRIIIAGSFFQMTAMCANNVIRAEGAAKRASLAMIIGAVTNMVLDPIFIFGLGLGIRGAAIATIASQALGALIGLEFLIRRRGVLSLSLKLFSPSLRRYLDIMTIGTPTFIQQLLVSVAISLQNGIAGQYGDAAVASMGVMGRLLSLAMMAIFGLGQGMQPLAGYAYGAGRNDRVKGALNLTILWGCCLGLTAALGFGFLAAPIVRLFSRDPQVIEIGAKALRLASLGLPLVAFFNAFRILFQALGRGRPAIILALARQGFILIPCMLLLSRLFGLTGLLVSIPVADTITAALTAFLGGSVITSLKKQPYPRGTLTPAELDAHEQR